MSDDDLRFGDVSGSSGGASGSGGIVDLFVRIFVGLIMLYVLLATVEILFNVPIPFVP